LAVPVTVKNCDRETVAGPPTMASELISEIGIYLFLLGAGAKCVPTLKERLICDGLFSALPLGRCGVVRE
jgi:hypothetical protein